MKFTCLPELKVIVVQGTLVDIHLEGLRKLTDSTLAGELPISTRQFQHACQSHFVRRLIICHVIHRVISFPFNRGRNRDSDHDCNQDSYQNNNNQVRKHDTRRTDTVNFWSLLHAYDTSFNLFRLDSTITLGIRYRNVLS